VRSVPEIYAVVRAERRRGDIKEWRE